MFTKLKNLWLNFKKQNECCDDQIPTSQIDLENEIVYVVGFPQYQDLASGDLNTFIALHLVKHLPNAQFEQANNPCLTEEGDLLPFLITKDSFNYFPNAYSYLDRILSSHNSLNLSSDELAWELTIEQKLILPFYRWLWNDPIMYEQFTVPYYGSLFDRWTRKLQLQRIYGPHYNCKSFNYSSNSSVYAL